MKRIITLAAVSVFLLSSGFAQAPSIAHDAQKFPIVGDDCMRIARQTLEREGYQFGFADNNSVSGARDIHRALIICSGAPDGSWVNVIVSSNTPQYAMSANEQKLLMSRLADVMNHERFEDRDRDRNVDHDRDRDRDRDHERGPGWFSMNGGQQLPNNAVAGGREPNHPVPQFVCRAEHEGNLIPGKTVTAGTTDCLIAYRELEIRKVAYDVLTGDAADYVWSPPNPGRPRFYTGNEGGAQLGTCRFELRVRNENRGLQLGKETEGKCVVSYKGIAYSNDRYEALYRNR